MPIRGLDLAVLLWLVSELPVEVDLLHVEPVSDEAAGQFGVRLELAVHERPHGCGINPVLSERLQLPVIALLVDRQLHLCGSQPHLLSDLSTGQPSRVISRQARARRCAHDPASMTGPDLVGDANAPSPGQLRVDQAALAAAAPRAEARLPLGSADDAAADSWCSTLLGRFLTAATSPVERSGPWVLDAVAFVLASLPVSHVSSWDARRRITTV